MKKERRRLESKGVGILLKEEKTGKKLRGN